jgi:hypothetical protein
LLGREQVVHLAAKRVVASCARDQHIDHDRDLRATAARRVQNIHGFDTELLDVRPVREIMSQAVGDQDDCGIASRSVLSS